MIYFVKRFIKPFIFIALVLFGIKASAQASLIQNAIDKLESYKNFSYQSIVKQKDGPGDTLIYRQKVVLLKSLQDKDLGYLFSIETLILSNRSVDLYGGQNRVTIRPGDSSYRMSDNKAVNMYRLSIPGQLKWIIAFLEKKPSKIVKIGDTTINAITYSHLIVNTYDTIVNNDHNYTFIHLFINKLSGIPDIIINKSNRVIFGDRAMNSYIESHYSDYKFDQDDVNTASFTIPQGFHQRKEWTPPSLAAGTIAPDWTLYATDGKKLSLSQMKGKVILLDFYYIGCGPCLQSLKPLNKLYEKYKNKNVIIASITGRDGKKAVLAFDKQYGIKYTSLVEAADVVKSYQSVSAPNFYFIDKEGKIAKVILGYDDDFEATATSTIDRLLSK